MKRLTAAILVAAFIVAAVGGCEEFTREEQGSIIGGVAGAVIGSRFGGGEGRTAAIVLGALAGSMIGAKLGRYMDEQDRTNTATVLEYNKTGQTSAWQNPDTGYAYTVTPTETYTADSGTGPCREFTMQATVGEEVEEVYGTACRQADGSWKIVK
ncbi:MAG: glycine zipper 2TM domain-containing protein [Gammaproteobacteria bacterium]|nr:glycine zipper 2TM domain-containing protein [Gammaproteobacteria bacterium]NIR97854.1 glycine zipper 2TM domain-containing protein [Gammaproteobacteria bacterium]NIT63559.1 glycine zipper 2TM domain-containing protein [Gammaproteobacteria bacterium]NIV20495.1 glycine zipper 2TM domain-containing protein [Gammaproteobacteria bacterium]NIX11089.1 glycine zipper 2TM domain-containing protein [Gammaproteobacteria bacterium]